MIVSTLLFGKALDFRPTQSDKDYPLCSCPDLSQGTISPREIIDSSLLKRWVYKVESLSRQQRIFAVQLFELHRLIKVQGLIASSSDVLLDEISYLGKAAAKRYPVKKLLPSEFIAKPPLLPHATNHRSRED
ncbi:Protein EARLY FLOWERING 3 [Raphanus sativus]|nr:Protein EARLY FLOWERING 3 [Raphanus sativus]